VTAARTACGIVLRKVGTPKSRVLANGQSG
jgi:hypothetical protein